MNAPRLQQIFHDWDVEFTGIVEDTLVDCIATVVLDYDGAAYEVLRAYYVDETGARVSYTLDKRETEKCLAAAWRQFDAFMDEASS